MYTIFLYICQVRVLLPSELSISDFRPLVRYDSFSLLNPGGGGGTNPICILADVLTQPGGHKTCRLTETLAAATL
jgi:hypothetical protein